MATPTDIKTKILPTTMPSQALYYGHPLYTTYTTHPQNIYAPEPRQKKSGARRFLRAIIFTAFGWLLIKAFLVYFPHGGQWHWVHDRDLRLNDGDWYYDIPTDLNLEDCVTGENWDDEERDRFPHSSITTFDVPIADTLFLLSRGQLSGGGAKVISSSDQSTSSATVKITAKYYRDEIRNLAKACLTSRREGENGIGIFTPTWHHDHPHRREDTMYFETLVILPEGLDEASPFSIKRLDTDLPHTAQSLGDLSRILFDYIALTGVNSPIGVASLRATNAILTTKNGPIAGTFNTSSSLVLITANSPIQVNVGLESNGTQQVVLSARTTNSPLHAELSLSSSVKDSGEFNVTTATTNSPLSVGFVVAPVDSKLHLKASTSNSPAKVFLHPTFEGTFDVKTSIFRGDVKVNDNVADPSGKDRKRLVSFSTVGRGHLLGKVAWQEPGKTTVYPGDITLSTSNSPVALYL